MTPHTHRNHLFRSTTTPPSRARLTLGALLVIAALLPIGCQSAAAPPAISPAPYEGPGLTVLRETGQCVVQVEAPSPGWAIRLDQVVDRLDYHEVYVTIRRPDPTFLYPQVIVQQSLSTPLPPDAEAWVYARIHDHGQSANGAYRLIKPPSQPLP